MDYEKALNHLAENKGTINAVIAGENFYQLNNNTFSGEILVNENGLRVNLTDEDQSNVIMSLALSSNLREGNVVQIDQDNQSNNNLMLGKLKDKKLNTGIGYLLTEGQITIEHLKKDKMVILYEGTAAEFIELNNKSKWKKIKGYIVVKSPDYKIIGNFNF